MRPLGWQCATGLKQQKVGKKLWELYQY